MNGNRGAALKEGMLVTHRAVPGIGRVGEIDGGRVRIDCFESTAKEVACSVWVDAASCRHENKLHEETRVYWQHRDTGAWRVGRIGTGESPEYLVLRPNQEVERVPESRLRVRWDMPVKNPVDVLVAGANESGYYRNTRLPMMHSLIEQRAACGGAASLLSAGIEIFPHQVRTAMTIISDPVQRYLLADEVGLGKTIEAGLVIRQILLDDPMSRIVIVVPDALRRQWATELREKIFADDFPFATLTISAHEGSNGWARYHGYDLVVVDEAHLLVQQVGGLGQSPYPELAALAHSARRVLLLSATPLTSRGTVQLGLLHLLDPALYKWTDRAAFERKFEVRKQLAKAVYGLDPEWEALLPESLADLAEIIPEDAQFTEISRQVLAFLTEDDELRDEADRPALVVAVEALRAHISETYRLHRRMIRHRRVKVTSEDQTGQRYELTGRAEPLRLELDSPRQRVVEDALLDWQSGISAWLTEAGQEQDAAAYGQVLGILVSRADTASDDFADCLRWRLEKDGHAADRAGLTSEERLLLNRPPVASLEENILVRLDRSLADGELAALVGVLRPVLARDKRVVVFCGAGSFAGQLANTLAKDSRLRVREHTRQVGTQDSDAAVMAWREVGGVLIADDSAEDGLNLQSAGSVVHVRLPWTPNRLEQRIGRVDRYQDGSTRHSARQFVVTGADGKYTFPGDWLTLLDEGFGIFSQSVSTVQDTIDQELPGVWATAVTGGPEGLSALVPVVMQRLAVERREIDHMDMLEAIHDVQFGTTDVAVAIQTLEDNWRSVKAATEGFAAGSAGGLRFLTRDVPGFEGEITQFERGTKPPLVAPRILAKGGTQLTAQMMRGAFDRDSALQVSGTRVFRAGNPFIDMLERSLWIDDRGQATAFLRQDRRTNGEAYTYFGFDFLVEADITQALDRFGEDEKSRKALRRQADCLLAPFTRRVWVQYPGLTAIEHQGQLDWLNAPYNPESRNWPDVNLNAERIGALYRKLGGQDQYVKATWAAEDIARRELSRVTDLNVRCAAARQRALEGLAVRRAQAQARQAADQLVTDTESYAADVDIADALTAGLTVPTVKVIAVICLIRGTLPGVTSAVGRGR